MRLADVAREVGSVTPLEVRVFAERWGQNHLPYPFTDRPGDVSRDRVERLRIEVAERLENDPPRQFEEWARTSISPDLRVEAIADVRRGDPSGESLRVNAVRRDDFGFVAVQTVFGDGSASGDITVWQLPAVQLARGVVAALPEPERSVDLGDVWPPDPDAPSSPVAAPDVGGDGYRRLNADPPVRGGFLQVREGGDVERRLDPAVPKLLWTDFQTFGRYTLAEGGVIAMDAAAMENRINAMVGRLVARIRERRDG